MAKKKEVESLVVELVIQSETALTHIHLLHGEDHSHRVWAPIQRSRNESRTLPQRHFKIGEHPAISWRLHHVCERCRAITKHVCYYDHVVGSLIYTGARVRIRAGKRGERAARIQAG